MDLRELVTQKAYDYRYAESDEVTQVLTGEGSGAVGPGRHCIPSQVFPVSQLVNNSGQVRCAGMNKVRILIRNVFLYFLLMTCDAPAVRGLWFRSLALLQTIRFEGGTSQGSSG